MAKKQHDNSGLEEGAEQLSPWIEEMFHKDTQELITHLKAKFQQINEAVDRTIAAADLPDRQSYAVNSWELVEGHRTQPCDGGVTDQFLMWTGKHPSGCSYHQHTGYVSRTTEKEPPRRGVVKPYETWKNPLPYN